MNKCCTDIYNMLPLCNNGSSRKSSHLNNMTHDDLFLTHYVFSSDDDFNPVEDIYVGYDERFNLIVMIEHTDYDFPEYNSCTYVRVSREETFKLSRRLDVSLVELPALISDSIDDDYCGIVNPSTRHTKQCFREILECFTAEGCRFSLVRQKDATGYACF